MDYERRESRYYCLLPLVAEAAECSRGIGQAWLFAHQCGSAGGGAMAAAIGRCSRHAAFPVSVSCGFRRTHAAVAPVRPSQASFAAN